MEVTQFTLRPLTLYNELHCPPHSMSDTSGLNTALVACACTEITKPSPTVHSFTDMASRLDSYIILLLIASPRVSGLTDSGSVDLSDQTTSESYHRISRGLPSQACINPGSTLYCLALNKGQASRDSPFGHFYLRRSAALVTIIHGTCMDRTIALLP